MKSKEEVSIRKMINYIDKALRYTSEVSFEEFSKNEEKTDATIFALSQVGELVKNIENETIKKYPAVPWIVVKNLRNKIVHDYEGIKLNVIWDIISEDIVQLKKQLEEIINNK